MALCRFRIDNKEYEYFKLYCDSINNTVSNTLRDFVATKIEEYKNSVATSVATNRNSLIKDPSYVVATNKNSVATKNTNRYPIFNNDGTMKKWVYE